MNRGDVRVPPSKCDEGSAVDLVGGPRGGLEVAATGEVGHCGVGKAL